MPLIDSLSIGLGIEHDYIKLVAKTASARYRTYKVPKRTGGMRTINHPAPELKAFQRWIVGHILKLLPVHSSAAAYEAGTSIRGNADLHVRSSFLLRMDFQSFFHSIDETDVRLFLSRQAERYLPKGWDEADSGLLAALVCRRRRLTIGAASSPSLINRMCRELDLRLHGICENVNVTYSRYADDMFFSTRTRDILSGIEQRVTQVVAQLDCPANLRINAKKTRHSSKKGSRVVTGLVLTSDETLSI